MASLSSRMESHFLASTSGRPSHCLPAPRTRHSQPRRCRLVPFAANSATAVPSAPESLMVPVIDPDAPPNLDGSPHVRWVRMDAQELEAMQSEMDAAVSRAAQGHALAQAPIWQRDLHRLDAGPAAGAQPAGKVQIPGDRIVTDPAELELVGRGLPIIHGGEWPDVYWKALSSLSKGQAIQVPGPHPKFSMSDMERIARGGPRFEDLVLEHVEMVQASGADQPLAAAYSYIPETVLGDWGYEVEPKWTELEQVPLVNFWAGLRARNWTSKDHFNPSAVPWRVQVFRCGYDAVTGWDGLRAVVTEVPGGWGSSTSSTAGTSGTTGGAGGTNGQQQQGLGRRFWVDMPFPGVEAPLEGQASIEPGCIGYQAVLAQLYQAHSQRLPKAAKQELEEQGYVTPGRYRYICPSDRLLDMSWHWTANDLRHPLERFLINPTFGRAKAWIERGVENSGIFELKALRDRLIFQFAPELPEINFYWNPNNVGPLYFLVCLTLGIVVPALRRNRILDITTLEEDPGAAMEFARSKATARKEGLTGVQFKDVAGLGPILNEVLEVVEFLKDPKAFNRLGARPPKGILLEGDPGTGKTLLAKALAGEAMVPFYQMAGTEFTEGIVGVGAARVRDLFKRSRANAPCVIFVDELDALGLKRAEGDGSGKVNEEREQTLNQLLTEMDGFTPDTGVVFIGATNRADLLDPALMRPGRFDRKVRMPKPDTEGRFEILNLHLKNKKLAPDVDLMQLSRDLPGLVGADLANIVNEAAMGAVRAGRTAITAKDMYAGVDRFTQGELRPPLPTSSKLPVTVFAAKESGIALVAGVLRAKHGRIEPVERVSIQPKGRSFSRTLFARGADEEYQLMTRGRLLDRIRVALAGHIAVRVVLGQETNLSLPDIKRACYMAEKYVFYYGMSDLGITTWAKQPYSQDFAVGSNRPRKVVSTDAMDEFADWPTRNEDFRFDPLDPSDPIWHKYTDEVRRVIKQCYDEVWTILESHRGALWAGVAALSEQREMLGGELRDVFDKHPPQPIKPGSPEAPGLSEMIIFTDNKKSPAEEWPYNIEWLNDAYPVPYWVRKRQEERGPGGAKTSAGPSSGSGSGGKALIGSGAR